MESDNFKQNLFQYKRLSDNTEYYNNVFKKTERICSAIFYILSYVSINDNSRHHRDTLTKRTSELHEKASASLLAFEHNAEDVIMALQHSLLLVESNLTMAVGARVISAQILDAVSTEVDLVMRYLKNHYLSSLANQNSVRPNTEHLIAKNSSLTKSRRRRTLIPKNDLSSDAIMVYSELSNRTTRIKTVLDAKPEATIKDLTDIITDVSAKTIQRDLNDLIEKGEVIRQGERRWSKYSLKNSVS